MSNSLAILIAFSLVFLLSLLRKNLLFQLQSVSLLLLSSSKPGIWFYTIFFLPGTIVHELSHWIMAEVLRVPTGEISILPSQEKGKTERKLGSVMTAKSDPIRGFFIGMAPLIIGTFILVILSILLRDFWDNSYPAWQILLTIYAVIVVGNSMLTSKTDRQYWPFMFLLVIALYFTVIKSGFSLNQSIRDQMAKVLSSINYALLITLGFNFALISLGYSLSKLLEKLLKKKITRQQ